jgi:hypothetical protein
VHARRAPALDSALAVGRHAETLARLCAGLGRPLPELAGLTLERMPRAGRFALEVPGDIRLALPAAGGLPARVAAFHAAGRALHAAFMSPELEVERRRVIDPALDAGFGGLLALCALDPLFIEELDVGSSADALLSQVRLERVLRLRESAAMALVELHLARLPAGAEPPADLSDRFGRELERASGVRWPGSSALAFVGAKGHAIARLRGFAFAALLRERLLTNYGRRFWRATRAWALLKELWNTGSTYDAGGLAVELGFGGLEGAALIDAAVVP